MAGGKDQGRWRERKPGLQHTSVGQSKDQGDPEGNRGSRGEGTCLGSYRLDLLIKVGSYRSALCLDQQTSPGAYRTHTCAQRQRGPCIPQIPLTWVSCGAPEMWQVSLRK